MGGKLAGRSKGSRHSRGVMSEINVTPMVDVMLVLLVIFMVTAPLLTAGVTINLPKAQAKAIAQQDNKPLEIELDAKGAIFLGETKVSLGDLQSKLLAIAGEAPSEQRIYLKADSKLDYGKVMGVMTTVQAAGFTKVALVTDPTMAKKD